MGPIFLLAHKILDEFCYGLPFAIHAPRLPGISLQTGMDNFAARETRSETNRLISILGESLAQIGMDDLKKDLRDLAVLATLTIKPSERVFD